MNSGNKRSEQDDGRGSRRSFRKLKSGSFRRRAAKTATGASSGPHAENETGAEVETALLLADSFSELAKLAPDFFEQGIHGSVNEELLEFQLPNSYRLPSLPPGYYFKGGAVRETLRRVLFPASPQLPFRDYDLFRLAETSDAEDHRLALKYMSDDYEFGHGVEVCEDLSRYFASRDLIANELAYAAGQLSVSLRGIEDVARGVLRPAEHVQDGEGVADGRTYVKAVRICSEAAFGNVRIRTAGFEKHSEIDSFAVALHLDRAFEVNAGVAEEFVQDLWAGKLFFAQMSAPPHLVEVVRMLSRELRAGTSFFKNLPMEIVTALSR